MRRASLQRSGYNQTSRETLKKRLESELEGDLDLQGFLGLADVSKGFSDIRVKIKVKSDVDDLEQLRELTSFSPVLETITKNTKVNLELERK